MSVNRFRAFIFADTLDFPGFKGLAFTLRDILRTEGIRGLFRGHSLTLARAIPHAAVGYTVYETISRVRRITGLIRSLAD